MKKKITVITDPYIYNVDLMKNVFFMHNRFDLYVNILLTEK